MKIAIIGATGFIGRQLVKKCIDEKIYAVCIDVNPFPSEYKFFLKNEFIEFVYGEVSEQLLSEVFKKVDSVVCLAAIRPTSKFGLNEYMINLKIATEVMKACLSSNLSNAVFISSRSVYSHDNMPWKEEVKNVALNLYGEAKSAVDNLIDFYNENFDMRFKGLRLAQVIGTEEKKGYLLNTLIDNAKNKKQSLIYGLGKGRRQYIYVKDVANAILHACKKSDVCGIFNIGIPGNVSIAELAEIIYEVFENPGNFEFDSNLPEDINCYEMSLEKMKNIMDFVPQYDIKEAILDVKRELSSC